MAPKHDCTRLLKPCISVRIDPCDCRYYYECSPQDIVRRCCAEGAVFNAKTKNCFFASLKICDINKPWTRCRLEDFGIAKDEIQSVSTCRKHWPEEMKDWNMTLRKGTTERRNSVTTMSTAKSKKTTRWSIATNYRPVSNVTVVRPTGTEDDIQPSRVPVTEQVDFETPAAKTYIPVIVFGMIALVAFVAIIILWKKRSDVKAFVAGLCCVGGKEKSKSICNPGYGNTIAVCDPRLDQTTGEHVYHEIPYLNPASVVNRPLPQTPQQQQTVRASTFSGFGCPDVAIRKEQQQFQRTNSACQTYAKLTSREDRSLIDAQERFAIEYQVSSAKTRPKNMSAQAPVSDQKSQTSEQQTADKTRPERNRGHYTNAADRRDSLKVNALGRHRTNSGKLSGIKEDLELSAPTINAADSTKTSDSESISASGNSQHSFCSEKNNPNVYSGVWNGISISGKTDAN